MIGATTKCALIALGSGFLVQFAQEWLASDFLTNFLAENLIALLIALLAINSATMGIVLTKVRDLVDSKGGGSQFSSTRNQMMHSVKEQIALVIVAVVFLVVADSNTTSQIPNLSLLLQSGIIGTFIYSLIVLYDTAKGVLIIVDFDANETENDEK